MGSVFITNNYISGMKMRAFFTLLSVTAFFFSTSCQEKAKQQDRFSNVVRDTSITVINSFSEVFFDSSSLEKFIIENKVPTAFAFMTRCFSTTRIYQY